MQDCSISSALAMEILQSYAKPLIYDLSQVRPKQIKETRFSMNTWWRHQMETFSALLAICVGNSPMNSPNKGQWRGALMFSLICAWINGRVNNGETGDLRRHCAHYDLTVMILRRCSCDITCRNQYGYAVQLTDYSDVDYTRWKVQVFGQYLGNINSLAPGRFRWNFG